MATKDDASKKKAAETGAGDADPFDLDKLAPKIEKHGEDITAITKRTEAIETILKPAGFLELLETMYKNDKGFDAFLSKVFVHLMEKDGDSRKAIQEFIEKDDRNMLVKIGRVILGKIGWLVSLLAAAYIGHLWPR